MVMRPYTSFGILADPVFPKWKLSFEFVHQTLLIVLMQRRISVQNCKPFSQTWYRIPDLGPILPLEQVNSPMFVMFVKVIVIMTRNSYAAINVGLHQ